MRAALGSRGDPDMPLEMTPGALESSRRTLVSVLRREPLRTQAELRVISVGEAAFASQ